ncbi:MAG: adaptor protein MecA [Clostridia bacterium]|nr:adaptor protein MecA [Clostridia bacterium]
MKIVRLAQDKVRVFLTSGDLLEMKIDSSSLTPDSPRLSLFLYEILEAVKEETGFSLADGQVVAEAIPKADGIILELSHTIGREKPARNIKKDSVIFEIKDFDALSGMLKNIQVAHLINMRLYFMGESYYVAVPKRRVPAILWEYSLKNQREAVAESKIAEYGKLIAGGYRLMCMAAALKKIN